MSTVHRVVVFSDVHIPNIHKGAWKSFKDFHAEVKPELTVGLGDIVDLTMMSRYVAHPNDRHFVEDDLKEAVLEINEVGRQTKRLILVPGNHEARWNKALLSQMGTRFRGLKGLSLESQLRAFGLHRDIEWKEETAESPGLTLGRNAVVLFHGHKQTTGWGTKNVASAALNRFPHISSVVGHHHRAQIQCHSMLDHTAIAIANPHLSGVHEYSVTPSWQRGFTVLEFYGRSRLRDCIKFTPHLIIMDSEGHFCWNGKVY